jgi:hypothetical protein
LIDLSKPKAEDICLAAVLLPIFIIFVFLLWEWDAGYESKEEGDGDWGINGDPSIFHAASDDEDAPPENGFSKVVGMSRISP